MRSAGIWKWRSCAAQSKLRPNLFRSCQTLLHRFPWCVSIGRWSIAGFRTKRIDPIKVEIVIHRFATRQALLSFFPSTIEFAVELFAMPILLIPFRLRAIEGKGKVVIHVRAVEMPEPRPITHGHLVG